MHLQNMIPNTTSWPIGSIKIPGFFRKSLCHNVIKLEDPESGSHYGFDDEVLGFPGRSVFHQS